MKVLLDENVNPITKMHLHDLGMEVRTVKEMGWGGKWEKNLARKLNYDADFMHMCQARGRGFDVFVTADQEAIRRARYEFGDASKFPIRIEHVKNGPRLDHTIASTLRLEERLEAIRMEIKRTPQTYELTTDHWLVTTRRKPRSQQVEHQKVQNHSHHQKSLVHQYQQQSPNLSR